MSQCVRKRVTYRDAKHLKKVVLYILHAHIFLQTICGFPNTRTINNDETMFSHTNERSSLAEDVEDGRTKIVLLKKRYCTKRGV